MSDFSTTCVFQCRVTFYLYACPFVDDDIFFPTFLCFPMACVLRSDINVFQHEFQFGVIDLLEMVILMNFQAPNRPMHSIPFWNYNETKRRFFYRSNIGEIALRLALDRRLSFVH